MCGAVFLPCLFLGLGLLSPDEWVQVFPKWQPSGELTLMIISGTSVSNDLPHSEHPHTHTLLSQESLQDLQEGLIQILMESLLCPGTQCTRNPVHPLQQWGLFPPVLWSSSLTGLQHQMLQGFLLPMPSVGT